MKPIAKRSSLRTVESDKVELCCSRTSFNIWNGTTRSDTVKMAILQVCMLLIMHCLGGRAAAQETPRQSGSSAPPSKQHIDGPDGSTGMPSQLDWKDTSPGWNEPGQKLLVTGVVFQPDGKTPASDIVLYYYHTNTKGRYIHRPDVSRSMAPNELGQTHGYLRGWLRTGEDGKYAIYTVMPAPYPNDKIPAHIHATIKEPDVEEYYIDDFVFDSDPFVNEEYRAQAENRCGCGILHLERKDELLIGKRDIVLGQNIPGHPRKQQETRDGGGKTNVPTNEGDQKETGVQDPKKILSDSNEAIRAIKTLQCDFSQEYLGKVSPSRSTRRMTCVVERTDAGPRFALNGAIEPLDGSHSRHFTLVHRPKMTVRTLHDERRSIKAPGENLAMGLAMDRSSEAQGVFPVVMMMVDPIFETESLTVVEYEGRVIQDGELCHVIYTEDNHEELYRLRIRYYLSASDLIPRRIESIAIRDDRVSMTVARLTSVKLNDTIDERAFDPAIQADYREELFSDRSTDSQTKEPVLPEWSLSDAQGKPCSLTDFRGSVVVMDFWGIWCNGCVKSLPKLQALHEEWSGKGVAILGMSYGDEPDDVVNFAEQKGLTYPQVIASTSLLDSLRIDVFPSIVIVDASGRLDRVIKGSGDESHQAVVTRIRELVQDQAHSR